MGDAAALWRFSAVGVKIALQS